LGVRKFAIVALVIGMAPWPVSAAPLGNEIPAHCAEYTPGWGDHRCAGLEIDFHHSGPASSPHPQWAGQWLFLDESGQYRVGSCTFQLGVHPRATSPSTPVAQSFPLDPSGRKRAYLSWRYGDTTDDLTAAAVWAVMHFYAQDAAGTSRSDNGAAPLVPDLAQLAEMTGHQLLEDRAVALDADAARLDGQPAVTMTIDAADVVTVAVKVGDVPLPGALMSVTRRADGKTFSLVTAEDGTATAEVPLGDAGGDVDATVSVPGDAVVYAGPPAAGDPHGVQTLVTAGVAATLTATVDRQPTTTTTTTSTTTTTVPETTATTTLPETTTTTSTVPVTTTSTTAPPPSIPLIVLPPETTTTAAPTTTTSTTTAPTTTTTTSTVVAVAPPSTLPRTGSGPSAPAYLGTALLVGGIGLLGTVTRRRPSTS
jgi:hypothetical protein